MPEPQILTGDKSALSAFVDRFDPQTPTRPSPTRALSSPAPAAPPPRLSLHLENNQSPSANRQRK
ncbi:MAG: hypothetical protein Q9162_002426 [Coniocarpon cinnabarinum]